MREISLTVICEKVKFSNCDFCNFVIMNGNISKLFKNIFSDVQTEGKEEIYSALYNYSIYVHVHVYKLNGLNVSYFINSMSVFNHQRM